MSTTPQPISTEEAVESAAAAVERHRRLNPFWWTVLLSAAFLSIILSIYMIFNFGITLK